MIAAQVTDRVEENVESFVEGNAAYPSVVTSWRAHHEVGAVVAELATRWGEPQTTCCRDLWTQRDRDAAIGEREDHTNRRAGRARKHHGAVEAPEHRRTGGPKRPLPGRSEMLAVGGRDGDDAAGHPAGGVERIERERELPQPPSEDRVDQPAAGLGPP